MINHKSILATAILLLPLFSVSSCYGNAQNNTTAVAEEPSNETLTPRHGYELRTIDQLLGKYHLKKFTLNDSFSLKIWDSYIEQLDPNRIYFTQKDIDALSKHKNQFDEYIESGNTTAALEIFNVYKKRVKERSVFAVKRVKEPFNFALNESYVIDRAEEKWAADTQALNDLWRKRIKNDLISLKLADDKEKDPIESLTQRYSNLAKRTTQLKQNEVFQIIANSFAGALEPHTSYFSPRASEEFNIQMRLSLDGIGAVLRTEDDYTKIVSIVPGGPADKVGVLKAGDYITGIAQGTGKPVKEVIGMRLSDVVNLIRGKKNTTVELTFLPGASGIHGKARKVSIVRDKVKLEHQAASKRIIDVNTEIGKSKIGVIDLPSFYIDFEARARGDKDFRSTTRDVEKLLSELRDKDKVDGVVIDLRGNGGGSLSEVISLTGLFIDEGPVVQVRDSENRKLVQDDTYPGIAYDGPIAVMVDRGSASASEIFAGAIKDYDRGIVIGETTFGKGTVQTILPIGSGSTMFSGFKRESLGQVKITTAQFFRVNGESTQYRGVEPDITWPIPEQPEDFGERSLKNAIDWTSVDKAPFRKYPKAIHPSVLDQERKISTNRIHQDEKFLAMIDKLKLLTDAGKEKRISLSLETRKKKREEFNHKLLTAENKIRKADKLSVYASIKQMQDEQSARSDDIFNKEEQPVDPFLKETANILSDIRYLSSIDQLTKSKSVSQF
ncbi:MAG: Tail-specific protease precursor (EC [uncultured Thiotrichaceae bacterium]|uniref:Tail-specific protease (EC) n=1 Tax=uncultured Thiotrichaceae bacterium TaxID=298394 RepID=A0A6S6TY80_9GAMM|nr:MAG: Tail-specific protease precursor (EC [uncultured Thiotrichaceae bacterium]